MGGFVFAIFYTLNSLTGVVTATQLHFFPPLLFSSVPDRARSKAGHVSAQSRQEWCERRTREIDAAMSVDFECALSVLTQEHQSIGYHMIPE
jgi:hypothetical protein